MNVPPATGQTSLAGFEAAEPSDRLFFAVYPDADTAARASALAGALRQKHGLHGKPLAAERLHVTLHHLGDYAGVPADVVRMASAAAARVECAPFDIAFERAQSFVAHTARKPFVLLGDDGVAAVTQLQSQLGAALRAGGLARWVAPQYTPHLTLLYDARVLAAEAVEPLHWRAREFVLVRSLLGRSRHEVLARWPLHV